MKTVRSANGHVALLPQTRTGIRCKGGGASLAVERDRCYHFLLQELGDALTRVEPSH